MTLLFACNDDVPTADGETGSETGDGDGDGDPGDGDGTPGDGDGTPGDGDGTPGDGDGTPGDGDGAPGDGDGAPGDGDGDPGDGDGAPEDMAMLRVLHLGLDAATVDVFLDDEEEPLAVLDFEGGTDYVEVPPGPHSLTIKPEDDPDTTLLTVDSIDLDADVKYSAVAHNYTSKLDALLLIDDDADIDPENVRLQISHVAPDYPDPVDIWALMDPPVLLVDDLAYGETVGLEAPAMAGMIGIDFDNDMIPDRTFSVPDLGGGNFIDLYAVNEDGGNPMFLLAHLPNGTTARLDAHMCGNNIIEGLEVCDGTDLGDLTCEDLGYSSGTLGCMDDCSDYDEGMCSSLIVICNDTITPIPDGVNPPVTISIDVPDVGTVAKVEISVNISHTWVADLDVSLDKDGQLATWMFRDITTNNNVSCSGDDLVAHLDDDAAANIQTSCINADIPAVNGMFSPEEPLANFIGTDIAGTWNLWVDDDAGADVGQVNEWCIYITPG